MSKRSSAVKSRRREIALCVFTILFCSGFFLAGLWAMGNSLWFYTWTKVPCEVERFEIRDHPGIEKPFSPDVVYHYEWQGRKVTGTQLRSDNDSNTNDYVELADLRQRLLKDGTPASLFCRVDPAHPGIAALMPGVVHTGAVLFALFGAGMGAMLWGVFRYRIRGIDPSGTAPREIVIPFCLLFTSFGGALLYDMSPEFRRYFQARHWNETSATVIWSQVGQRQVAGSRGGSRTIYYPDVFYRYEVAGREYRSDSDSPFSPISVGYKESQRLAQHHPANSLLTCYVNPNKPWQAVLDQSFQWRCLAGLMALPFLIIGVSGLVWSIRTGGRWKQKPTTRDWLVS